MPRWSTNNRFLGNVPAPIIPMPFFDHRAGRLRLLLSEAQPPAAVIRISYV